MISNDIKEGYLNLIDSLGSDAALVEILKGFVGSYDGTNEDDFHRLVIELIGFLTQVDVLRIKSEGYDRVSSANNEAKTEIQSLIKEFEDLRAGKFPVRPPALDGEDLEEKP